MDIKKVIAFQLGQVFSLIDNCEIESYTKNGIIKNYNDLKPFLLREKTSANDMKILNNYLEKFISFVEDNIKTFRLYEKLY